MNTDQTQPQPAPTPVPRRGRGKDFPLWLLPEQRERLIQLAAAAGARSPSAFIKSRIFDEPLAVEQRRVVRVADPELLRSLAKVGNNLNQVARILNRSGEVKPEDAAPLLLSLAIIAESLDAIGEQATAS